MMGDRYAGKPSLTNHLGQLSLASLGVTKSSTSFGWGKGGNVTSAGWQVTLCDPIWHVSSRSGNCRLLYPSFSIRIERLWADKPLHDVTSHTG